MVSALNFKKHFFSKEDLPKHLVTVLSLGKISTSSSKHDRIAQISEFFTETRNETRFRCRTRTAARSASVPLPPT